MTSSREGTAGRTSSGLASVGYASLVGLLVVAGCLAPGGWSDGSGSTTVDAPTTAPPTATDGGEPTHADPTVPGDRESRPGALESSLYGLVVADDRATYADTWGLEYRDGRVAVVVELRDGAQLPDRFDASVRSRHENLVHAIVPVDELLALAEHENVSFVRPPRAAVPDESPTKAPNDDS